VTVTVTSNATATATITTTQTAAGGVMPLTFNSVSGTSVATIFVQGLGLGSTTLTVHATGYTDGTGQVTVDPSGFTTNAGNFSTTVSSPNTTIPVTPARLHPTTLNWQETQALRGGLSVPVAVTSPDAAVGTITTSPLMFNGGDAFATTEFAPVAAGTATITVGTPTGFDTPSNNHQITATVTP
jgi:hypothetical protein